MRHGNFASTRATVSPSIPAPGQLHAVGVEVPGSFTRETAVGRDRFACEGDEPYADTRAQFLAGEIVERTAGIFCEVA